MGERYGSLDSRSERSSYIIAPWVGVNGNIDPTTCDARPGVVSYYVKQNVFLDGEWRTLIMARVNWFQEHPERQGCRVGAVVRALAFHQCVPGSIPGPGVICGLSLLVLYSAPRGFSPGTPVFPSPQKPTFDLFDLFDLIYLIYSLPN